MPKEECHPGGQVSICLIPQSWGRIGQGFLFMEGVSFNKQAYMKREAASASGLSDEASRMKNRKNPATLLA